MVQTAKVRYGSDMALPQDGPCQRRIFVQRQVRADAVVVVGVGAEQVPQMRLVEDD